MLGIAGIQWRYT